jgi:hypothetical protein
VARSPRPGRHVRPSGKVAAMAGQGRLFAIGPRRPARPRGAPPPPRHRRAADAGWDEHLDGPLWSIDPDGTPPDEATIYARAEALRLARDAEPIPRDPFGDGLPRLDVLPLCEACALMLAAWREREALRRGGIVGAVCPRRIGRGSLPP